MMILNTFDVMLAILTLGGDFKMKKRGLCSFALGLLLFSVNSNVHAEQKNTMQDLIDVEIVETEVYSQTQNDKLNKKEPVYVSKKEAEKIQLLQKKYRETMIPSIQKKFIEEPVLEEDIYQLGKFDPEVLVSVEKQLNFYRELANLKSIQHSADSTVFAQYGAIGMASVNQQVHDLENYTKPTKMPSDFWQKATESTNKSNIYSTREDANFNDILDVFIFDPGESNRQTGHRWNILGLPVTSFGVGYAKGEEKYYTTLTTDKDYKSIDKKYSDDFVTQWPSQGYFPIQLYSRINNSYQFDNMRWSVMFNEKGYEVGEKVSVELLNNRTGERKPIIDGLNGGEVETVIKQPGFLAQGGFIGVNFKPSDDFKIEANTKYTVKITGMLKEKKPIVYEYSTHIIDIEDEYEAEDEVAKELAAYKDSAKLTLEKYKVPSNYRQAQQTELTKILKEANYKINKAANKTKVDELVKITKEKLDKVKTAKELTEEEKNLQGPYIKDGRFVTISKKGYSTWSNFNWKKRNESTKLLNKTYQARGKYIHNNGSTYLSLYDNQGKWQGYINSNAVKAGSGKQGAYIKDGRYVTISKSNYDVWSNFSWKRKIKSKSIFNKTYQVKGRYEHFNGSTYYSLYDSKGKWQGYINSNATKMGQGKQGAYISDGRKVKVTKTNYNTWSNFNWKKRHSSKDIAGKTFIARGKYNHINGSTYYSLYDNKGKWYGYISQHAVK